MEKWEIEKKIEKYNYPDEVQKYIIQWVADIANTPQDTEKILARFALHTCELLKKHQTTPRFADNAFNLIFLFLEEHEPLIELGEESQELLFEGQMLSDLGESYALTIKEIEALAKKIEHPK